MSYMTPRERIKQHRRERNLAIMELASSAGLAEPWQYNGVTLAYLVKPQPTGQAIELFAELVAKATLEGKL